MKRLLLIPLLFVCLSANATTAYQEYRQGNYAKAKAGLEGQRTSLALYYLGQMAIHGYAQPVNEAKGIRLIDETVLEEHSSIMDKWERDRIKN